MHIVVISGADERIKPNALALLLCKIWHGQGHRISHSRGEPSRADVGLLHVDTTRIDPIMMSIYDPEMPIINRHVLDISKRTVSRNLVDLNDSYDGKVVLKTDENAFGIPKYPPSEEHRKAIDLRESVDRRNWRQLQQLPTKTYPIMRKDQVPDWVWTRQDIVVEKYLPEIEDGLYVLRLWVFLGPREFSMKVYGRHPIVKSGETVRYEYIDDVPDELRAVRKRLGFDFGKFDYVMHEGKAVLLDANKTPHVSNPERVPDYATGLAAALLEMFPNPR